MPGRPSLTVDGEPYDVDYFGMDDGASDDPRDARRFLFQLGRGLMIYLYVIQAGSAEDPAHFSHSFWTKDCAVAEVELEEHGAPGRVVGQLALPVVFDHLEVRGAGGALQWFEVQGARFSADQQGLALTFTLRGEGGPGQLRWSRSGGYRLEAAGSPTRELRRFTFAG